MQISQLAAAAAAILVGLAVAAAAATLVGLAVAELLAKLCFSANQTGRSPTASSSACTWSSTCFVSVLTS
jgi:hypothetical protein